MGATFEGVLTSGWRDASQDSSGHLVPDTHRVWKKTRNVRIKPMLTEQNATTALGAVLELHGETETNRGTLCCFKGRVFILRRDEHQRVVPITIEKHCGASRADLAGVMIHDATITATGLNVA